MSTNKNDIKNEEVSINAKSEDREPINSEKNQNKNCLWKCNQFWLNIFNRIKSCFYSQHEKPGGLRNSKSTCYMNAMIQALSSSDFLLKKLESLAKPHSNLSLSLLYDLLNAINETNKNNETLMRNTNLLGDLIKSVGWTKSSQQDAFDLLAALITDICRQSNVEIPLRIKLLHEFQGIDISNRIQKYLGLSLDLCGNYEDRPGVPLQFLINNHFLPTAIDGDQSKLVRLSLYQEIPNILLIHIQANKWDPISCEMIKPIYYIQYEENMTLWFDIANEMNGKNRNLNEDRICSTDVQYHLKSIVYHVGNISGGHYVAYKIWRNQWYLANDESISKSKKYIDNKISPYIMIYERSYKQN